MNTRLLLALIVALSLPCAHAQTAPIATPTQLTITDTEVGTGREIRRGAFAVLHYIGWVFDGSAENGKGLEFVNTRAGGQSLSYVYGYGRAFKGLELGLAGMRVGGKRTIVIPPKLGYDDFKHLPPKEVPKNSALIFEVELIDVVPQSAPPDQ